MRLREVLSENKLIEFRDSRVDTSEEESTPKMDHKLSTLFNYNQ